MADVDKCKLMTELGWIRGSCSELIDALGQPHDPDLDVAALKDLVAKMIDQMSEYMKANFDG